MSWNPFLTEAFFLYSLFFIRILFYWPVNIYMLFTGWEVRIVKNCDRGLENFQARGHSFSRYGPTQSR